MGLSPFDNNGLGATLTQDVLCPTGASSLLATLSVLGSPESSLPFFIRQIGIECTPCASGQSRTEGFTSAQPALSYWYCKSCSQGQYIINPNQNACQNCPGKQPLDCPSMQTLLVIKNAVASRLQPLACTLACDTYSCSDILLWWVLSRVLQWGECATAAPWWGW